MTHNDITEGTILIHPNKPEWGPGKVVKVTPRLLYVIWRDVPGREAKKMNSSAVKLEIAPCQNDPILDNLPPLKEEGDALVFAKERIVFTQAKAMFIGRFPQGFEDSSYTKRERDFKWDAHEFAVGCLGNGRFRELLGNDPPMLIKEVCRCEGQVNLLSRFEKAAFHDALKEDGPAKAFLAALADLLDADDITEEVYTPYINAVCDLPAEKSRVASWPVATIMPFLLQPDRHMFLKPEATRASADALGFNLNYNATPNWLTYRKLLDMAAIYREKLANMKPRDMIDVQSFLWVTCGGGYE